MRDRAQAVADRLHLGRRLGVHLAEQRLAEVRERRAGEAADEALDADHPELKPTCLAHGP